MASNEVKTTLEAQHIVNRMVMVVTIHESTPYRVRKWIAVRLLWLAAWVLGCGIEVEAVCSQR